VNDKKQNRRKPVRLWDEVYPGRFLKGELLDGREVTVTIKEVFQEELETEDNGNEFRLILTFAETEMQFAANKTNRILLRETFGREAKDAIGKQVTLGALPDRDPSTGKMKPCVRVLGAPSLAADKVVTIKFPKRKPKEYVLKKTQPRGRQEPETPEQREPGQEG